MSGLTGLCAVWKDGETDHSIAGEAEVDLLLSPALNHSKIMSEHSLVASHIMHLFMNYEALYKFSHEAIV